MKRILISAVLCVAGYALGQICNPFPVAPIQANQVCINLPIDGGSQGCTGYATSVSAVRSPSTYPLANAACGVVRVKGDLMVNKDNGWDDGGIP